MIYICEEDQPLFKHEQCVADFFNIDGEISCDDRNRKSLRFSRNGRSYFIKCHFGVGWLEIIKNLIQFKLPVLGAKTEWLAIQRLHELGVPTLTSAGFGQEGANPAKRRSFIITRDIGPNISLENFCKSWPESPPDPKLKWALIYKLAEISRKVHGNGLNHRDYYICHFLLSTAAGNQSPEPDDLRLFLIDLHRMQIRRKTPERWIIKDIAGLYFSSMDIGLTKRDVFRFIKAYRGKNLRQIFNKEHCFWEGVLTRAVALYEKVWRREPILPF